MRECTHPECKKAGEPQPEENFYKYDYKTVTRCKVCLISDQRKISRADTSSGLGDKIKYLNSLSKSRRLISMLGMFRRGSVTTTEFCELERLIDLDSRNVSDKMTI